METLKPDKYGRWLVNLYLGGGIKELTANEWMVANGHAVKFMERKLADD